jgi:hypothetical protein
MNAVKRLTRAASWTLDLFAPLAAGFFLGVILHSLAVMAGSLS